MQPDPAALEALADREKVLADRRQRRSRPLARARAAEARAKEQADG